ncbi:LysR family transcriptional regulator [Roseibium marinum]|uniref:DNA-binding transcriptional LysR family regulator n=1 Tax=Roseibium marinum TaxID=281252 RepID=A0A2S3UJN3_9HYPH|nr:LysR family transcriptional regulator [Roseibium marinum]POF27916.1 DNA-binding transcriptional LysR family regulator [Roseibium marinum]
MDEFQDLPNLRHLRAFSLTAMHRSVHKAAAEIFLSQPAVTQAISKLETEFDQTLFERTPSGMFCTKVGEILLARVDRAFAELKRACEPQLDKNQKKLRDLDPTRLISSAQIRAITAIADHGNFAMAARALGMSRPSIQRTARALEKALGYKLFVRSSNGIGLSVAGDVFARGAKLASREIELAREEIEQFWGQKVGRMVVGSLPLSRIDLVPQALMRVLDQIPDLNVQIVEGSYESQLVGLRNGDIDLIVGALREPPPCPGISQTELFVDPLSVVVRAGHPLARHSTVTLSDTVGYAWIVPRRNTPSRNLFHKAFRTRALAEPKRLLEVCAHGSLRALLTGSDRVALVSRRQVRYEEESGLLKVLPINLPDTARPIGLTTRADWVPSAAQSLLIAELKKAVTEYSAPGQLNPEVRKTRTDISLAQG